VAEVREFFQAKPIDPRSDIAIETTPKIGAGAVVGTVELDGKPVSEHTPFVASKVKAGPHRVRVAAKGFTVQDVEVEAKAGEVTPLSLALQSALPSIGAVASAPSPGHMAEVHEHKSSALKKTPNVSAPVASSDYTPHILILTATPASRISVDSTAVGTGAGLHLHLDHASGDISIASGVSLSYFNRGNRVSIRPNFGTKSTLSVDGEVASKGKVFELDQRPRRVEITDAAGVRRVILLKLAD
jgi:hypothetical protein